MKNNIIDKNKNYFIPPCECQSLVCFQNGLLIRDHHLSCSPPLSTLDVLMYLYLIYLK